MADVVVTIRPSRPEDRGALRGIYVSASLSNAGDRSVLEANPEALVFEGAGIGEGRTRVAVEDGVDIVGFSTYEVNGACIEIEDLFVEPECMRRGVGSALVADLFDVGRSLGCARIEVVANNHAMAFYNSMGFAVIGSEETRFRTALRLGLSL